MDARDTRLGAFLTQTINRRHYIIAYAIRKFRSYLESYSFKVITDYMALKSLHNLKNPTRQLAKWALELLEFDYEVIYRKKNPNLGPTIIQDLMKQQNLQHLH